jgi:hypothetical protein
MERVAREIMGRDVGVEELMESYYANETSNAMKQLRIAGETESVGGVWMRVADLTEANVETISVRRLKKMRGELKAQMTLAHDHGLVGDAAFAGRMLEVLHQELAKRETVEAETAAVS